TRLSKLFPESPDDNTYILVQRPPPVQVPAPRSAHARDGSHSVTPVQLIPVPKDHIEQELAVILSG
ncbi:hypothetical protein BGZ90_010034, partial [Linnemannia elongata]